MESERLVPGDLQDASHLLDKRESMIVMLEFYPSRFLAFLFDESGKFDISLLTMKEKCSIPTPSSF